MYTALLRTKQLENSVASTGSLRTLQSAFSLLADPNAIPIQSLQKCLSLNYKTLIWDTPIRADSFPGLLDHVGSAIVDLFFMPKKGGLSWVEFVRGYVKCCGRMPSAMLLNVLLRVFAETGKRAGLALNLEFESSDVDCKISALLLPVDMLMFLWMRWTFSVFRGNADVCLLVLVIWCCLSLCLVVKLVAISICGNVIF